MSRVNYSRATREALGVLGLQVAAARRERRWTLTQLSERAGISINTLRGIEAGTPTVAIGTAFEVATLVGVQLFGAPPDQLPNLRRRAEDRLALLPARIREPEGRVSDDF